MKKKYAILYLFTCILISATGLAQGEANNWYFGNNAGVTFLPDGTVTGLNNGKLVTNEGCSTISDAQGNLLFYTDGRNVWDRNHLKMPNGNYNANTGLLGDPSSSQSGIIVPKKGNPNIYYIFTVDEPHHDNANVFPNQFTGVYSDQGGTVPDADDGFNNGLNYSVVDLSVTGINGSIGNVTTRNVHLVTYDPLIQDQAKYKCSEKITAVKTADGSGFWVITHFIDKFYAFKVDGTGVNSTPVISTITPSVPISGYRRNSIGYLKASPDGQKLAIAHQQRGTTTGGVSSNGVVMLYDFNPSTGTVSNGLQLKNNINPYGIEFSAEAKKLYVSYDVNSSSSGIRQYDLLAADIPGSEVFISVISNTGALQLGPNKKIYFTEFGSLFLSAINSPELDGPLCDFQQFVVEVGGPVNKSCTLGLPPFITSLFSANITAENTCLGNTTQLRLSVNSTFDTVKWNFGDGTPETPALTTPEVTHIFPAIGQYNITATVVKNGDTTIITSEVNISAVPVANTAPPMAACDANNDGVETFVLSNNDSAVLGTQPTTTFEVKYFASQPDADANTNALNGAAFPNTANPQSIFARIQNKNNTLCYATTSFQISVSNTPQLAANSFSICDDNTDGNDANGQATFNLNAVTQAIVHNPAVFTTTYYPSLTQAQGETGALPNNFYNTTPNQQVVFARIKNTANPACFRIDAITLNVNPLPPVVTGASLVQCDLAVSPDGFTQFSLSQANSQFTGGNTNLSVTYFATAILAQNGGTPLSDNFTNTANPQQIAAKVTDVQTGCFRILPLMLIVNSNTSTPIVLQQCDDDGTEDGLASFTLTDAGLETPTNTVVYYANANDALLEQNAIASTFTNTTANQQSVYARIENNNQCATLQEIKLIVRSLPDINTIGEGLVCLNTGANITLDPGLNVAGNFYAFVWSTGATSRTIAVNQPGTYTVRVIDTRYPTRCEKTRTITVTASDVAVITGIDIVDLTTNNTVTVHAVPGNNVNTTYQYSIDLPDGPYQDSNFFENVEAGIHTVYVYDTKGCGVVHQDIAVLSIPKYFTPNHDGVHDTWNIIGVNALFYKNSKIYIFDRFGKLLADVDPRGLGWTGIYNGHPLPATDYWYVVQLDNGRTVKGHFSLMR